MCHSASIIRRAITYSGLYNNNWNEARHKYILTSKHLYETYHIYISSHKLKSQNVDVTNMMTKNVNLDVTADMRQTLKVTTHTTDIQNTITITLTTRTFSQMCKV
jgi:hypothetical protein